MPGRRAGIADGRDAVARGHPLAVPPVDVTIGDAAHGSYAFPEVGAAVEREHQGPDAERLPHRVVAANASITPRGGQRVLRPFRCLQATLARSASFEVFVARTPPCCT